MSIRMEAEKTTANSTSQSTGSENAAAVPTARTWLESLSPEECAAALSFRDGPFIASFLELATSSLSTTAPSASQSQQTLLSLTHAFDINDLKKMMVNEKEWEETLSRQAEELREGSSDAVAKTSAGASATANEKVKAEKVREVPTAEESAGKDDEKVAQKSREKVVEATAESGEEEPAEKVKEEAEVFRIRGEGKEVEVTVEAAKESDEGKGDTGGAAKAINASVVFSKGAKEIAENACVISPAAAAADFAGNIPFIAIHPAFLKKGTGECIRSMDRIIQAFSPSSGFLSDDLIPEKYLNEGKGPPSVEQLCLQRVQSLMKTASDKNAPVMLLLVLLVRIEVAACMAFRESKNATKGKKNKSNNTERLDSEHVISVIRRLDSFEAAASPKLDEGALKKLVAPLTEAGYCSLEGNKLEASGAMLQNVLVTPLPALLKLFSSAKASNRATFQGWNKAWNATIQNLLEIPKVSAAPTTQTTPAPKPTPSNINTTTTPAKGTPRSQEDTPEGTDTSTPSASTTTSASAKKKNRKKRRYRRKTSANSNADGSNNSNTGDVSPAKNAPPKVEPVSSETPKVEGKNKPAKETKEVVTKTDDMETDKSKNSNVASPKTLEGDKGKAKPTAASKKRKGKADDTKGKANDDAKIAPTRSNESDKLVASPSDETASTKSSESTKEDEPEANAKPASKPTNKSDFTVSRVHGVGTVVVAPSITAEPSNPSGAEKKLEGSETGESATADDNHDEWETVEVKVRGKKKSGRATTQQNASLPNNGAQTGAKKSKAARTSASRKRVLTRRIVKDIVSGILENVEEEVRKLRQQEAREARNNAPAPAPAQSAWKTGSRTPGITADKTKKKEATLGDVVVGKKAAKLVTPKRAAQATPKADAKSATKIPATQPSGRANQKNGGNASPLKAAKGQAAGADQNTAPTIPETVSAVSDPRRLAPATGRDIPRSDASSTDTDGNRKQEERTSRPTDANKTASPEPPLPTLLNPGNVNSASSSVASSLEAPHAVHGHHHTSTSNEVDVGYHLLDVCDRLTRDMDVFMARRTSALTIRRRERGALLGALQDSVSSIWAGHSHVELYGSCATMLDLPSSDLDVVVCGLDQMEVAMNGSPSPQENMPSFGRSVSESISPDKMNPDLSPRMRHSVPHFVPMHLNAERVVRLAAELERQPWAVHVKAIPTASVPVVKVLADPSRLPGAVPSNVEGEEWMMQQHHTANQGSPGAASPTTNDVPSPEPMQAGSPHYQPTMSPGWRGADVINGLLKLDITFEGPEHGGIGSTEFSARVVQNVSDETGLAAESTAFVQVIMVVKELLAQRRLNEPFSGGLSSYSLLLLVLAVMCERKGVQEELERVERQRRVVAAGGGSCEVPGASTEEDAAEPVKDAGWPRKTTDQAKAHPCPATPAATQESKASMAKSDSKGTAPTQIATQGKKQVAKTPPTQKAPQGKKQATKAQPNQNNAQGNKQAAKAPPQNTAKGSKQATLSPQQNTAKGNKQATKSPQQNATKASNKQATKGHQQAANNKQATKSQPQTEKRTQGGNQQQGGTAGGNQPRGGVNSAGKPNAQVTNKAGAQKKPTKSPGNSWASIAMGKNAAAKASSAGKQQEPKKAAQPSKPASFADAVARNAGNANKGKTASAAPATAKPKPTNVAAAKSEGESGTNKKQNQIQSTPTAKTEEKSKATKQAAEVGEPATDAQRDESATTQTANLVKKEKERKIEADEKTSKFNNYSSEPVEPAISSPQSAFPQGFNDVIEVLCSGEATPGKLLMHFLLFYGQHFDAHATAIDISGKHHRDIPNQSPPYTILSPYIQRRSAGSIDPVTGMLTVDPIVVYDPLEGAENNNVARRCFLWSSVKWVFAQSYMTLSSAAEQNTTPPGTPGSATNNAATAVKGTNKQGADAADIAAWAGPYNPSDKGSLFDPSSPLLELLLSF